MDLDLRKFDEILPEFGHTIQLVGAIYGSAESTFLITFPHDRPDEDSKTYILDLSEDGWKKLIRQTDLLETEILAKDTEGKLVKTIIRKCTRQIEQGISWKVYKRDGYRCRYCGADDMPLTVDHLVLWEDGGPSIEENLVASCRKCNKTRGRTPYKEWLEHPYYKKVSKRLMPYERKHNKFILADLDKIPLRVHTRSR